MSSTLHARPNMTSRLRIPAGARKEKESSVRVSSGPFVGRRDLPLGARASYRSWLESPCWERGHLARSLRDRAAGAGWSASFSRQGQRSRNEVTSRNVPPRRQLAIHFSDIEDARLIGDKPIHLVGFLPVLRSIVEAKRCCPPASASVFLGHGHQRRERILRFCRRSFEIRECTNRVQEAAPAGVVRPRRRACRYQLSSSRDCGQSVLAPWRRSRIEGCRPKII